MMLIPLKEYRFKVASKATGVFLIASFTLAGFCFFIVSLQSRYTIFEYFTLTNISVKLVLLSTIAVYLILQRVGDYIKEKSVVDNFLYDLEIPLQESKIIVKAFLDTGNCLREPVTNLPCIILDDNIFKLFKVNDEEYFHISYNTIGNEGIMKGIKEDKIRIIDNGKEWRTIEAIICGCPNKLSEDNEFNALLSRGVI